jgi:hypothetical protein
MVTSDNAATAHGAPQLSAASSALRANAGVSSQVSSEAEALLLAHSNSSQQVSRSYERAALRRTEHVTKRSALPVTAQNLSGSVQHKRVPPASPREIAMSLLSSYGWDSGQFSCLDSIWTRESDWNPYAANASSGAYGIPQSLPGSKMAAYGSDWQTNAETQIKWGLGYIRASYGSPCGAWYFWESHGWY